MESFICENNRDILEILQTQARDVYQEDFILTEIMMKKFYKLLDMQKSQSKRQGIWLYFYEKLTYSLLVAADYYATSEYSSGINIDSFGEIDDITSF